MVLYYNQGIVYQLIERIRLYIPHGYVLVFIAFHHSEQVT